jgi:hypothetical protein
MPRRNPARKTRGKPLQNHDIEGTRKTPIVVSSFDVEDSKFTLCRKSEKRDGER